MAHPHDRTIPNLEFTNEQIKFRAVPVFYECQRCTACCRWPGIVRVTEEEITRLSALKAITEHDFIQRYTRLAEDRRSLVLTDNERGECIFLEGNDCAVQSEKPRQCREFPNLWNFPGFEKICHAIPHEVTFEAYQRMTNGAARSSESTSATLQESAPPDTLSHKPFSSPIFKPFTQS